jgi:hypothetical protein
MNDEDRAGWVTPGQNAVDEALGLTEDPRPEDDNSDKGGSSREADAQDRA